MLYIIVYIKIKSFKCLEYKNIYQYHQTSKYEDWGTHRCVVLEKTCQNSRRVLEMSFWQSACTQSGKGQVSTVTGVWLTHGIWITWVWCHKGFLFPFIFRWFRRISKSKNGSNSYFCFQLSPLHCFITVISKVKGYSKLLWHYSLNSYGNVIRDFCFLSTLDVSEELVKV